MPKRIKSGKKSKKIHFTFFCYLIILGIILFFVFYNGFSILYAIENPSGEGDTNQSMNILFPSNNSELKDNNVNITCFGFSYKNLSSFKLYINESEVQSVSIENFFSYSNNFSVYLENSFWKAKCVLVNSENEEVESKEIFFTVFKEASLPMIYYVEPLYSLTEIQKKVSALVYYEISDGVELGQKVYFTWYVNGINVENNSIEDLSYGIPVQADLNYSVNSGDLISLNVIVSNGEYNSSVYQTSLTLFTISSNLVLYSPLSSQSSMSSLSCDNTYCYASNWAGYFLKINHITGEHIFNDSFEEVENEFTNRLADSINSMFCDDTYCYAASDAGYAGNPAGYFTKINHVTGEHILDGFTNSPIFLSDTYLLSVFCDNTYCYFGDGAGYFSKVNKITGEVIFDSSSFPSLSESDILWGSLSCDDTYCYTANEAGYFLKINHITGEHIFNYTFEEGGNEFTKIISHSGLSGAFSCDNDFCYALDTEGYFIKINKTSGNLEAKYNDPYDYFARPSLTYSYSLFCDNTYCYAIDSEGYFIKLYKDNGTILYGNSENSESLVFSPSIFGEGAQSIFCNTKYCFFIDDWDGYFTKINNPLPSKVNIPQEENQTQELPKQASSGSASSGSSYSTFNLTNTSLTNTSLTNTSNLTQLENNTLFLEFENISEKEYVWEFKEKDSIKFNSHTNKEYTLKINEISSKEIRFSISNSAYKSLTLREGKSTKLSLTPEYYDLFLKVNSISSSGRVSLTMKGIFEKIVDFEVPSKNSTSTNETLSLSTSPRLDGQDFFNFIIGGILILILAISILLLKRRKKSNKK